MIWGKNTKNKILSWRRSRKEKEEGLFLNFALKGFKSKEICDAVKHLPARYDKHSKHLPNTHKFHHITIENKKVVGYFLTKTCPCHHQIEQNQEKTKSDVVVVVGQFYKVRYSFLNGKGGEVVQVLRAMCSKNDLEEHLFTFLKSVRENHYLLDDSDQAWINESDIREALPFPNLTRRGEYKWENI